MSEAVGRGGQRINVWPAKDLIIVFTGGEFEPGDIAPFILKALKSDTPLMTIASATARLKENIAAATRPLSPKKINKLPEMAAHFRQELRAFSKRPRFISFEFSVHRGSSSGAVDATWREVELSDGLDDVERFSTDTFVDLPFVAKGKWETEETFLLQIGRVGGINRYDFRLKFSSAGKAVDVSLREVTGLNNETFTGKATR